MKEPLDIKQELSKRNMKQVTLSRLMDIPFQTISNWYVGRHKPTRLYIRDLKRFFKKYDKYS